MDKKISKLLEILAEVDAEVRKDIRPGEELVERYWQGKKDGIRISLIVLDLVGENDENEIIAQQRTSAGSWYTQKEDAEVFAAIRKGRS